MIGLKIRRVYYSSAEICKEAGITQNMLRSWEKKYPELHPAKNKSGRKCFRPNQLKLVQKIDRLKSNGFTNEKIHELLLSPQAEPARHKIQYTRPSLLREIREGLHDIINYIDTLPKI